MEDLCLDFLVWALAEAADIFLVAPAAITCLGEFQVLNEQKHQQLMQKGCPGKRKYEVEARTDCAKQQIWDRRPAGKDSPLRFHRSEPYQHLP